MESLIDGRVTKWKNLKQRLGLKVAMGCCGVSWSPRARISTISILDDDGEEEEEAQRRQRERVIIRRNVNAVNCINIDQENSSSSSTTPLLVGQQQQRLGTGMNLAMALEAERNLLTNNNAGPNPTTEVKTLMRLIEETDGVDWNNKKKTWNDNNNINVKNAVVNVEGVGGSSDWVCCVCMERKKGAAFIPCGHTFCRVCSREVRVNKGSCPVCNRSILDILDLF